MTNISEALTQERNTTHGDFSANARVSQMLKQTVRIHGSQLTFVQFEALDMICLKLSRILSGRSTEADHWRDIAGYAQLALFELIENTVVPNLDPNFNISLLVSIRDFCRGNAAGGWANMPVESRVGVESVIVSLTWILSGSALNELHWKTLIADGEAAAERYA